MTVIPRWPAALAAALFAALLVAVPVAAHAELETAEPADGSEVPGPFEGPIDLTFTEALAGNSGAELLDADGAVIAEGAIPADDPARIVIDLEEPLDAGAYRIEIVAIADDGHIERPVVEFTVLEPQPTPVPTPEPTPVATDSEGPSPSPASTSSPSPLPSPTPTGNGTPAASTGDVALPIAAALVALAVLGLFLLRTRRNRAP